MKTEQLIWFIDSRSFYKSASLEKIVRLANIHQHKIKVIIDASALLTGRGYWHLFDDTDNLSHEASTELDRKKAQLQKFFTMNAIKADVIVNQSRNYLQTLNNEIEKKPNCILVIEDTITTKRHPIFQEFKGLNATILLLTHKLWKSSISILAAVDPLHEHARPDELDDNIVSLTKVWATSLKSSWVIVHCCYIASVLTQYKSKLITMHREGFSAFAKRNRLHNKQCVLLEGIPEDALSSYIEKHHVDILVIGLVARNTLEQFWVGSTTSALLCSPPCDLLLIKK